MSDETPQARAVVDHLGGSRKALGDLLAQTRAGSLQLAIGDFQRNTLLIDDSPAPGVKRVAVRRQATGYDSFPVPLAPGLGLSTLVLNGNPQRLGGRIVNSGTNPVILYLMENGNTPGRGAIYLPSGGVGTWDFRLGNIVWCGGISAVAQTGASTLSVVEV